MCSDLHSGHFIRFSSHWSRYFNSAIPPLFMQRRLLEEFITDNYFITYLSVSLNSWVCVCPDKCIPSGTSTRSLIWQCRAPKIRKFLILGARHCHRLTIGHNGLKVSALWPPNTQAKMPRLKWSTAVQSQILVLLSRQRFQDHPIRQPWFYSRWRSDCEQNLYDPSRRRKYKIKTLFSSITP